jgi:hypothetical protein
MLMPRRISQKMGDVEDILSNATIPTQMIRPPSDTDMGHNEVVYDERPIPHYEPQTSWLCCTTYKDRSYFQNVMEHIDLSPTQKQIIQSRYLHILENFQKRTRNHSILFFTGHFIVTVGSLFVPALLSVQNSGSNYTFNITNFTVQIYWAAFIISLMVTICNGILTLFKVDKKYYFLNTTLERLRSEGWQYFGLTGRYSGHLIGNRQPTHQNQFVYFTHYIEKIKMKQVEEEYYKTDEKTTQVPNGNHSTVQTGSPTELYPRSPEQPISSTTQHIPEPVKYAVNSIIKSQKIIEPIAELSDGQNTLVDNELLTANVLYKSPNSPLGSPV